MNTSAPDILCVDQSFGTQTSSQYCYRKIQFKYILVLFIKAHESKKVQITLDTAEEIAKWREERKRLVYDTVIIIIIIIIIIGS